MNLPADLWIAVLAGTGVFLLVGIGIALFHLPMIRMFRRLSPSTRSLGLFVLIAAPILSGLVAAIISALSGHLAFVDLIDHHCHSSIASCTPHVPASPTGSLFATGVGFLAGACFWIGLSLLDGVLKAGDQLRLFKAASRQREDGTFLLPSDDIFAVTGGLLRHDTFYSSGLTDQLSKRQLGIVQSHEHAHALRHDNLFRLLAIALGIGHWPRAFHRLFGEMVLAQEQACDAAAAKVFGEVDTAETLIFVERLRKNLAGPLSVTAACVAFLDTGVKARAEALLRPSHLNDRHSMIVLLTVLCLGVGAFLLGAEPLHHEIETFILYLQS